MAENVPVTNKGQYSVEVWEEALRPITRIYWREIDDPFVRTVIRPRGWRVALAALLGRLEFVVNVSGSRAAGRVVFAGDYTPTPAEPVQSMGLVDGEGPRA